MGTNILNSQQTCVAPVEDEKKKDLCVESDDTLEEIALSRLDLKSIP